MSQTPSCVHCAPRSPVRSSPKTNAERRNSVVRKFLKNFLAPSAMASARDSVKEAMKVVCQREADAAYHRSMKEFHRNEAANTNPHFDWWIFAEAKEAEKNENQDYELACRRVGQARA